MWSFARIKKAMKAIETTPEALPASDDALCDAVRKDGPRLLAHAAESGAHVALPVLLRLGAAVRPPSLGPEMLVMTLAWSNIAVFTKLLAAGIEPDVSVLDQAVFRQNAAVVRKLVARGVRGDAYGGDKYHPDRCPMHTSATSGWRAGTKILLDAGVPVDVRTKRSKQTSLHLICDEFTRFDATSYAPFLVKHGANPNARDAKGRTPADLVRITMAKARNSRRPISTTLDQQGQALLRVLRKLGAA